ncbi:MAG: hypothetical protein RLZZ175_2050 [Bacteroidota bacterium]|jgi:hypothetical protein
MSIPQNNQSRTRYAIGFIVFTFIINVVLLFVHYRYYREIQHLNTAQVVEIVQYFAYHWIKIILKMVSIIVFIFSAITFIQWFRRAYTNVEIDNAGLKFKNDEIVLSFLNPITFFNKPYFIMKELFETLKLKTDILKVWWGTWIFNLLLNALVIPFLKQNTVGELSFNLQINIISNIVWIVLSLLTIKVIQMVSSKGD